MNLKGKLKATLLLSLMVLTGIGARASTDVTHYEEPGLSRGRDYVTQQINEYIDPFSGNLQLHAIDLSLPGSAGFNLNVQRSYNRNWSFDWLSPFGAGWDIHFGRIRRIWSGACAQAALPQVFVLELPDGSQQTLHKSSGLIQTATTDYLTTKLWKGQCLTNGMAIFSPDGTRYDMTEADTGYWHVKTITNRFGSRFEFSYVQFPNNSRKFVSSIAILPNGGSDSRTVLFTYSGEKLASISGGGRTWSYNVVNSSADSSTYLKRVTPPGNVGGEWSYEYYEGIAGQTRGSLKSVTNPQLGRTTYTYKTANFINVLGWDIPVIATKVADSDTWTFDYTPSCPGGGDDTTRVTLPASLTGDRTITYRHFGICSVNAGDVWKVGLLRQKVTGSVQTETFDWVPQTISNESHVRPGYNKVDTRIYRPLLNSKTVVRDSTTYITRHDNSFDTYGNPLSVSENGPNTRTRTLGYDNINFSGKWIIGLLKSDSLHGLVRNNDPNTGFMNSESRFGVTTTFSPNSDGSVQAVRDANSHTTTYSDYKAGVPRGEGRADGIGITRTVDNFGNIQSQTDGFYTWYFEFDGLDRLTKVTPPRGSPADIDWTNVSKTFRRNGLVESTNFDRFGRPDSKVRNGVTTDLTYDALGRKTFESQPGLTGTGSTFTYDVLGRIKRIDLPISNRVYEYNLSSGRVRVTNENGIQTTFEYDRYGDPDEGYLTAIRSPDGTEVTMLRDTIGNLTRATQGGVTRNYGYYGTKFLQWISDPETGMTTFVPDYVGNVKSKTMGGVSIGYDYDAMNRLKKIKYGGALGDTDLDYDSRGKLTDVNNTTAQRHYEYDQNGNLKMDRLTVDGRTFEVGYAYDLRDGLESISYPTQGSPGVRFVELFPDVLGRPTKVWPYLSSVTYRPSGNFLGVSYANGVFMTIGEDSQRQIPNSISAGAVGINMSYVYDNVGNVRTIHGMQGGSGTTTFSYDGADRLKTASGAVSGQFDYWGSGDIKSKQFGGDPAITLAYNSSNLVSSVRQGTTTWTYAYDSRANTTSNGRNTFEYDLASNLIRVDKNLPTDTSYGYDGRGWRVWQQKNGIKTYFHHAMNGDLLFEYSPTGDQWKQHMYLAGKRIATRTADLATAAISVVAQTTGVCDGTSLGNLTMLTATVTPFGTTGIPTGTVAFTVLENPGSPALPLVNGSASWNGAQLRPGTQGVYVSYSGDERFAPINIPIDFTKPPAATVCVPKAPPNLKVTVPDALAIGVPFKVTIKTDVVFAPPTGAIDVAVDAGVPLTAAWVSTGVAEVMVTVNTPGLHTLTAHYPGDTRYKEESKSITVTVSGPNVTLNSPATDGQVFLVGRPITLTATATAAPGTSIATLAFLDGAIQLQPGGTSSPYTMSWTNASLGEHFISARATDTNGGTGASGSVRIVVRNAGPAITLSGASSNSCTYTSIAEDLQGNWTVACGAGSKTFSLGPGTSGTTCAAYAGIAEDINGNWAASGCIP